MKAIQYIIKTREYLDYLEEHIHHVYRAWIEIQEKCKDLNIIYDDFYFQLIDWAVKHHDISKLSEEEFVQYRKAFYPLDNEAEYDISRAWEHHKENNPHHWENWAERTEEIDFIWDVHCTHMIIDWMAMSYKFGNTPRKYYESNKDEIKIPEFAEKFIYRIFDRLEK